MGGFYYIHSVALIEDLPLEEHYSSPQEFYAAADRAYSQVNNQSFTVISFFPYCTIITNVLVLFLECIQLLDCCLHLCLDLGRVCTAILFQ